MKRNIRVGMVCIAAAAFGISSCKKLLNVNTNPNVAQTTTVQTLLPAAQLWVGSSVGVDLEIDGSIWGQYWTQNPGASQYHALETYNPGQDVFLTPWGNLYTAAENFFQLYKLADSQHQKQYMAIALLMKAYTFQVITDGWGDVPFRQALKGQYIDSNITNPKYDAQLAVYNGIIATIDSANKLLSTADLVTPGTDDLIYGGNMAEWQKFSNTLLLKVYVRMSAVNPTAAQAGVAALYATNPSFIDVGDDAFIAYGFNTANKNPLYAEEVGLGFTQNLIASETVIDAMNANNDPRLHVFFDTTSAGTFVGTPQGYEKQTLDAGTFSTPSIYVAGNAGSTTSAKAPVNLITSYESLFLQAEVSARGWANPGNDGTLFANAINANFNYYSGAISDRLKMTSGAVATAYMAGGGAWVTYPLAGTLASKLSFIITQKWFAMCGNQGFEAWTEWRRTGYPNFFTYSQSTIIGNNFPKRFLYPTTESTTNSNFPGLAPLTSKVWWDLL